MQLKYETNIWRHLFCTDDTIFWSLRMIWDISPYLLEKYIKFRKKQLAIIESWRCSAGTAACWLFTVHSNVHLSYRSKLRKCIIFFKCWLVNPVLQFIKVIHHQWWDINLRMSHNRFFPSDRSRAHRTLIWQRSSESHLGKLIKNRIKPGRKHNQHLMRTQRHASASHCNRGFISMTTGTLLDVQWCISLACHVHMCSMSFNVLIMCANPPPHTKKINSWTSKKMKTADRHVFRINKWMQKIKQSDTEQI